MAILSGVALVMFSIIFFRLWYLQVLSGDKYLKQAENNQVREITVRAPRGQLLDRNGNVLVDNRTALALQLQPTELPQSHRKRSTGSLAAGADRSACRPTRSPSSFASRPGNLPAQPGDAEAGTSTTTWIYYLRENQE